MSFFQKLSLKTEKNNNKISTFHKIRHAPRGKGEEGIGAYTVLGKYHDEGGGEGPSPHHYLFIYLPCYKYPVWNR